MRSKNGPVGAGKVGAQHCLASDQRVAVRAKQGVLRTLAPNDLERPWIAFEARAHSETLQLMAIPERGSVRDPEQQISERGKRGGLPSLVRSVEDVDVGVSRRAVRISGR